MIKNPKELEKFFEMCRKQGIYEFTLEGVGTFKLGELPKSESAAASGDEVSDPYKDFPTGTLSPDELMFYSSGGAPNSESKVS